MLYGWKKLGDSGSPPKIGVKLDGSTTFYNFVDVFVSAHYRYSVNQRTRYFALLRSCADFALGAIRCFCGDSPERNAKLIECVRYADARCAASKKVVYDSSELSHHQFDRLTSEILSEQRNFPDLFSRVA